MRWVRGLALTAMVVLLAALIWPELGGVIGWGSIAVLVGCLALMAAEAAGWLGTGRLR